MAAQVVGSKYVAVILDAGSNPDMAGKLACQQAGGPLRLFGEYLECVTTGVRHYLKSKTARHGQPISKSIGRGFR